MVGGWGVTDLSPTHLIMTLIRELRLSETGLGVLNLTPDQHLYISTSIRFKGMELTRTNTHREIPDALWNKTLGMWKTGQAHN